MTTITTTVPHPLNEVDTDFISHIESVLPQTEEYTDDEMYDFIRELDDIDITNKEQFDNRFYTVMDDSHKVEAEFAEEFIEMVYDTNTDAMQAVYHAIDFQRVWDHSLDYDFDYFINCGEVFFFHNH